MLKDQLPVLNEPEINPFAGIEGPENEEKLPPFMVVDEDEDDDIDIHWTLAICQKETLYLVFYILFSLENDMLTSTYFAFY